MPSSSFGRVSPRVVLIVSALAFAAWLGHKWWWGLSHVTTDNAQIEGHIVPVLAKVGGYVAEVKVDNDQPVKSGDLLARIDDRDYRAKLAQAEADLQLAIANAGKEGQTGQASAQVAAARAAAAAARSGIEQAIANADNAQKDLDRARQLVEKKMLAPQTLDAAEAAARAASAQVSMSRESATSAGAQVTASGATLTRLAKLKAFVVSHETPEAMAQAKALRLLDGVIMKQATMLAFERLFLLFGVVLLSALPLLLMQRGHFARREVEAPAH